MNKKFFRAACLLLALAVVFGAFGAHALKSRLASNSLQAWQTGVQYHFIHAIGMLVVSSIATGNFFHEKRLKMALLFHVIGIALFSGSLYLLAIQSLIGGVGLNWLGPITPIGGVFFIAGWLMTAISIKK